MPKEVKAYACAFGCRRNVTTKKKTIEIHEKTCFHNPARRACITCKHQGFDILPVFRRDFSDTLESVYEHTKIRLCNNPKSEPVDNEDMGIVFNCPSWDGKSGK